MNKFNGVNVNLSQTQYTFLKDYKINISNLYPKTLNMNQNNTTWNTWTFDDIHKPLESKSVIKNKKKINQNYGVINNHIVLIENGCLTIDRQRFLLLQDELFYVMNFLSKTKIRANIKSYFIANYEVIKNNENIKEVFDYLIS